MYLNNFCIFLKRIKHFNHATTQVLCSIVDKTRILAYKVHPRDRFAGEKLQQVRTTVNLMVEFLVRQLSFVDQTTQSMFASIALSGNSGDFIL